MAANGKLSGKPSKTPTIECEPNVELLAALDQIERTVGGKIEQLRSRLRKTADDAVSIQNLAKTVAR